MLNRKRKRLTRVVSEETRAVALQPVAQRPGLTSEDPLDCWLDLRLVLRVVAEDVELRVGVRLSQLRGERDAGLIVRNRLEAQSSL